MLILEVNIAGQIDVETNSEEAKKMMQTELNKDVLDLL